MSLVPHADYNMGILDHVCQEISYVHEETWSWGSKHSPLAKVRWSDCEANIAIPTRGQDSKLRPHGLSYKCKRMQKPTAAPVGWQKTLRQILKGKGWREVRA